MTPEEKTLWDAVKAKLSDKKATKEAVKKKYAKKEKTKKLTDSERIARIEEYLGL